MLVYFQKWARNSLFVGSQMTVALITENANDLHQQLVRNPFTAELELPYPDEDARLRYIRHHTQAHPALPNYLEMSPEVLARDTAGLTIVQLRTTLAEVVRNAQVLSFKALSQRKRDVIESEAGGLLSFVETRFNLEAVAGHRYAKANLRAAAAALKAGRADVLPMGYLVNGPVGTGKTFLVSCFAAEIGVPMVELKNFRSQYVGVTEANLEKVLRLLKAMSPVAVMIDEADATLGNRGQGGDSGVSSRVFSTIASFMSNTEHRGRIIWFLLTARPDLMPIDLKRQGRAEEHIALFYPETLDEKRELLAVMLRKTKIALAAEAFPDAFLSAMQVLSGADMEAALTRAKFRAAALGLAQPTLAEVEQAFADFIPPSYPEEVEYQNLVAALECTSRELLPERYRNISRAELTAQLEELRPRLGR
jgi:SpoVK/Ycf46/Vps4 family AAA+-type ATPase